jgi:LPS export ABC transporter protein LptC
MFVSYKKIMAALLTGCFFLCACENDEKEVYGQNKKKIGVEEAKNIKIIFTTAGNTKAILTSPLMLRVQDTVVYTEFPKMIYVDFYNAGQKLESKLKANYAKYKEDRNIVFMKDSVKVINIEKGDTLYCQELYWDRNRTGNEFYTDKPVRIRTKTQVLDGTGLDASQDFKNWHITYPVGPIKVPASQFPQ